MTGRLRPRRTVAKARKGRSEAGRSDGSPSHDGARTSRLPTPANMAQVAEDATERERLLGRLEASQVA